MKYIITDPDGATIGSTKSLKEARHMIYAAMPPAPPTLTITNTRTGRKTAWSYLRVLKQRAKEPGHELA